ncbi:hypothetical protein GJ496_009282 [Pomphorhynchus laevis]|nr:hypothetical protein GJ496_009282 [Pomphorhynchus laevis]
MTLAILLFITIFVSLIYGLLNQTNRYSKRNTTVHIIVLGRADQSPRTVQHAIAIAQQHYDVCLIAYGRCPDRLPDNVVFRQIKNMPFVVKFRTLHYACTLLWLSKEIILTYLSETCPPFITIVQNPPGLPILPISFIYCKLVGSLLVMDWHNYGSSILSLKLGSEQNWKVQLYWYIELLFGILCDLNLCVSKHMAEHLRMTADINAHVFYDRPISVNPSIISSDEILRCEISGVEIILPSKVNELIVVTSSSWTVDENFATFWNALCKTGPQLSNHRSILCIITGKGPELKYWQNRFKSEAIENVRIITMWLHQDIYPRLLSSAEVGVCLHTSSSGVDLPMKVQDMLGAGLPVLCYDYGPCIREIADSLDIQDNDAFSLFQDSDSLSNQLTVYAKDCSKARNGRIRIKSKYICTWQDEWNRVVYPLIKSITKNS